MEQTIFERLGKEKGIAKIVDDIVDAHMQNPKIQSRFLPYKDQPQRLIEIKKQTCDLLSAVTGGPVMYNGRSMVEAHKGMNVSEYEFMAATDDILNTLDKHGVDQDAIKEILSIVYSTRDDVMHA